MRLAIVNDGMLGLAWRRRRARERSCLCGEVRSGILIEVLELLALEVVEGILSKECVSPRCSPLDQQGMDASKVGCRETGTGKTG